MANLNKIVLIGNLTEDPEMRFTADGSAITKYKIAVNRPKKSDGSDSGTDFMPIVCFGRLAEVSGEYLKKGKMVLVEGRIQNRSYDTAEGQTRWVTEIVANEMKMLDKAPSTAADNNVDIDSDMPMESKEVSSGETFDDIPF